MMVDGVALPLMAIRVLVVTDVPGESPNHTLTLPAHHQRTVKIAINRVGI
jgi:hypothetical protein